MSGILDILSSNLTEDVISQMSNRLGTDKKTTSTATEGAINILLAAMNKNAQKEESRGGLLNALTKDHDGGILDDIMGYAAGTAKVNERTANGAGVLGHLLGGKQSGAIEMLMKMSGMDKNNAGSLLSMLAPIVMGAVGKNLKTSNVNTDGGGLMDILSGTMNSRKQNQKEMSMIEKLIDQDGDGSVIDDLLSMGMKFLRRK